MGVLEQRVEKRLSVVPSAQTVTERYNGDRVETRPMPACLEGREKARRSVGAKPRVVDGAQEDGGRDAHGVVPLRGAEVVSERLLSPPLENRGRGKGPREIFAKPVVGGGPEVAKAERDVVGDAAHVRQRSHCGAPNERLRISLGCVEHRRDVPAIVSLDDRVEGSSPNERASVQEAAQPGVVVPFARHAPHRHGPPAVVRGERMVSRRPRSQRTRLEPKERRFTADGIADIHPVGKHIVDRERAGSHVVEAGERITRGWGALDLSRDHRVGHVGCVSEGEPPVGSRLGELAREGPAVPLPRGPHHGRPGACRHRREANYAEGPSHAPHPRHPVPDVAWFCDACYSLLALAPRVDVVANLRAHHLGEGGALLGELRRATRTTRAAPGACLHETRSLEELASAVRAIRARGCDSVLLAGGDGSYMAGTTALFHAFGEALPAIGFLPGGTVSTVARNWGLGRTPGAYARSLVADAVAGRATVTERPTLRIRDDNGGDRVGFIFGAGLVARFFDAYYEAPDLGYATAARLVARIFAGTFTGGALAKRVLTPGPAQIFVDGVLQQPKAWSLIAASVVRDLGLHMHLLYRAAESRERFHIVASPLPPRQLSPQVGRVLLGQPLRGEGHVDALASEVRVEMGTGASTYVLDGDRIEASTVTLTAGPVLRYLSPSAA